MAKEVLTNARVEIGSGNVLGNLVRGVTIDGDVDLVETTGFGDTTKTYVTSYKNWRVTLDCYDDFASNQLNQQVFSWWGTTQTIKIRKDAGSISTGNPEFQGSVIFQSVPLMNAQNGQVAAKQITLQGTGTLTRATA